MRARPSEYKKNDDAREPDRPVSSKKKSSNVYNDEEAKGFVE